MNKHLISSTAFMAAAFANAGSVAAAKAPRIAPAITAKFKLETIPEKAKTARGSKSPYGFDTLEINEAFGVKNKTAHQMSSIVSNQNRGKANQVPKKDASGAIIYVQNEIKDAAGNVVGHTPTTTPETVSLKEWRAVDVDEAVKKQIKGTPLEGSSVLVIRVK